MVNLIVVKHKFWTKFGDMGSGPDNNSADGIGLIHRTVFTLFGVIPFFFWQKLEKDLFEEKVIIRDIQISQALGVTYLLISHKYYKYQFGRGTFKEIIYILSQ